MKKSGRAAVDFRAQDSSESLGFFLARTECAGNLDEDAGFGQIDGEVSHFGQHNAPSPPRTDMAPIQFRAEFELRCCRMTDRAEEPMTSGRARSTKKGTSAARHANLARIPKDLSAVIKQCWPHRVVEEFDTDESYFHQIRHQIERDVGAISSAVLAWQTEEPGTPGWKDHEANEPLLSESEWQSYHIFFVSPHGDEFRFEDETIAEDPEDGTQTMYPGEGLFGLALTLSLVAPVAVIDPSSYSHYEDGSVTIPDPMSSVFWNEKTGEALSANAYHRDWLGEEMFRRLEVLRQEIILIMGRLHISVLDDSVLDLPVKDLRAGRDVFVGKPVRVRDAFFFRGV